MKSEMERQVRSGWPFWLLVAYAVFITVSGVLLTADLQDDNLALQNAIGQRDSLIASIQERDSIYNSTVKSYSEVITRYISDCNLVIDGRKVSTQQLVNLFNQVIDENESLADSLSYYKRMSIVNELYKSEYQKRLRSLLDSLTVKSKIVELANRDYGIKYEVANYDRGYAFTRELSKLDSALVLFPYYRDRIRVDTTKGNWIITTETRTFIEPAPKRKKEKKKK